MLLVSSGGADLELDAHARAFDGLGKALARAVALMRPTVVDGGVVRGLAVITGATRAQAADACRA